MEKFFYELVFTCENVEECTYKIFELESFDEFSGLQVLNENSVKIFSYDIKNIDNIISKIESLGFKLKEKSKTKDENWIIKCESELERLQAKQLEIIPVIENENHDILNNEIKESDLIPLKIIPGMAFGTGHHETTKNILLLLQDDEIIKSVKNGNIKNAMDVGTGSAILAIGANLLYKIPVLAFDNDKATIENAKENIEINGCKDNIKLFCGEIKEVSGKFDLILANIYAEILIDIFNDILKASTNNTFLILSGIQEFKLEKVMEKYSKNFDIINKIIENGWASVLLRIKLE